MKLLRRFIRLFGACVDVKIRVQHLPDGMIVYRQIRGSPEERVGIVPKWTNLTLTDLGCLRTGDGL